MNASPSFQNVAHSAILFVPSVACHPKLSKQKFLVRAKWNIKFKLLHIVTMRNFAKYFLIYCTTEESCPKACISSFTQWELIQRAKHTTTFLNALLDFSLPAELPKRISFHTTVTFPAGILFLFKCRRVY